MSAQGGSPHHRGPGQCPEPALGTTSTGSRPDALVLLARGFELFGSTALSKASTISLSGAKLCY
jgi:hypothetical protein